jgi:putative transposase
MSNYRRSYIPGGTFFFTVVTEGRAPLFKHEGARASLRGALQACRQRWPFRIDAIVLLPEHLHALWTLPEKDTNYSTRWAWIKKEFTKAWLAAGGAEQHRSWSRRRERRRGVWQRRFWEHTIWDADDFERHFDYIHYNPVKHGLAECPSDWPFSSFHRWVRLGVYPKEWGGGKSGPLSFEDLDETAMEL